jgi:hypothetical protein
MHCKFVVEGTAADGQTYKCEGEVDGTYPEICTTACVAAFKQLTGGKAVYGQPGVGCRGPYKITRFELVTITE